jgi:hypothetical protein
MNAGGPSGPPFFVLPPLLAGLQQQAFFMQQGVLEADNLLSGAVMSCLAADLYDRTFQTVFAASRLAGGRSTQSFETLFWGRSI